MGGANGKKKEQNISWRLSFCPGNPCVAYRARSCSQRTDLSGATVSEHKAGAYFDSRPDPSSYNEIDDIRCFEGKGLHFAVEAYFVDVRTDSGKSSQRLRI